MLKRTFLRWVKRAGPPAFLFFVAAIGVYAAPQASGYHVIRRMPVGGEGNWDYLRVDPDAHRIYISRSTPVITTR